MTIVKHAVRYVSSSNAGEYWRGAETIERSGKETIEGRPDVAGGQGLRRGGLGCGGGAANGSFAVRMNGREKVNWWVAIRSPGCNSVLGFLPARYMGFYSATKHAVEEMSETPDHEVRQFGIRVSLVEPGFTKSNLDANSPQVSNKISAYNAERDLVSRAIAKNVGSAPEPDGVADTIVCAALGAWCMRHTPKGQASLLSKLRRFMSSGPLDQSLRKSFGLR